MPDRFSKEISALPQRVTKIVTVKEPQKGTSPTNKEHQPQKGTKVTKNYF